MFSTWHECSSRSRIAVVITSSPASISGQSLIDLFDVMQSAPRRQLWARLVGGDADRAPPVAIAHQAEEQVRLLARERLEAYLVDDHQAGLHVLLPLQARRRHLRVLAHGVQQLVQAEDRHREAALDGLHAQRNSKMCLP